MASRAACWWCPDFLRWCGGVVVLREPPVCVGGPERGGEMNSDTMLSRVRKLLAMAEDESLTEQARESYNAKAAELIAQYGIDRALVEEAGPDRVSAADVRIDIDPPYARDKIDLLASVAVPL